MFIEKSGQARYWAMVVSGGVAIRLKERLLVSHVGSEVWVEWKHVHLRTKLRERLTLLVSSLSRFRSIKADS